MQMSQQRYEVAAAAPAVWGEPRMPAQVRDWHEGRAACTGCKQRILSISKLVTRGPQCFHDTCARRYDQQQKRAAASTAQTIIGTLVGIALPAFGQQCLIRQHDLRTNEYFNSSERFEPGCFATSIERGGQFLTLNHEERVPGRLTLFDGPDLRFRFQIHDTAIGRTVLEHARRGDLLGASIGFRSQRSHCGRGSVVVHEVAHLSEDALCLDRRPAWYGTVVQEEL
jgi:Caudovirus prohead serine protease